MNALSSILDANLGLTALLSAASMLAVWVPFYRGFKLCLKARTATRRVKRGELKSRLEDAGRAVQPLAVLLVNVLRRALRENERSAHPTDFVVDASKQYVINEYDANYARPISMFANLLPPIGFIGTTGGLLILFMSRHLANESLEVSALALALTSSIFALIGFSILEALKIRVYGRLLSCLDDVISLHREGSAAAS